jgi:hypothetical protein
MTPKVVGIGLPVNLPRPSNRGDAGCAALTSGILEMLEVEGAIV